MVLQAGDRMYKRRHQRCDQACTTCQRRKERCNGNMPCARCVERGVERACSFTVRVRPTTCIHRHSDTQQSPNVQEDASSAAMGSDQVFHQRTSSSTTVTANTTANTLVAAVPETSRLIQDNSGKYMFIGDSANLSMLQHIRNLTQVSIGTCPFVEDPHRYQMVEAIPRDGASWLLTNERTCPPFPNIDEATYLIQWFISATNCVLDLFDEEDLLNGLPAWLSRSPKETHYLSTIYFLVFAIGAQTCPDDKDALASLYFDHGRYLTAAYLTEDPSITTVQAYAMITMYMLCASRRNAAFMYLGTGVRAAYALGLHRSDISGLFTSSEDQTRERLWKVIRILDLFMSASLGRPVATAETRDTELEENYSASNDLCAIFERILNDIYAKRMVSTDSLGAISQHHRRWAVRFRKGLKRDNIADGDFIDGNRPNVGLLHVKEAYYWTIILLSRPFFMEFMSNHITIRSQASVDGQKTPDLNEYSHQVLVHACIDAAVSTIQLLSILLKFDEIPRRLPFVVNSLFVAGLVLGLSHFADLNQTYPIQKSLQTALRLFALFPHDAVAKRTLTILELLYEACDTYTKQQEQRIKERNKHLVNGMFGRLDNEDDREDFMRGNSPSTAHGLCFGDDQTSSGRSELQMEAQSNQTTDHMQIRRSERFEASTSSSVPFEIPYETVDPPLMSPKTLWFGSYEHNMPLFATIDTQQFLT